MTTHQTHHIHSIPGSGKEVALRWLVSQLRWERLLDDLRHAPPPADEEEAA